MDLGAATHPGYIRSDNEDGFFVSREQAVFAVADGMGGHEHGEVASQLALDAIAQHATILSQADPGELANDLYDAVQAANASILSQAEKQDARNRMGTTLVLVTVCGDRLYFAHIGDSRLYLLRGEVFSQLTRDHSLVQSMVDSGEISADEAAIHPLRHQITRVVGGDNRVSPEIASQALEPGDIILLCSDGLSGAVEADAIKAILRADKTAQERADLLVQAALAAGGPDNITVVVASYQRPRPIPHALPEVSVRRRRVPTVLSLLLTVLTALAVVSAITTWIYFHPSYSVSVDTQGVFGLYKHWPLLPTLSRQYVPCPDVPPVTLSEAQPYLTQPQFQPKDGDMQSRGIAVKGKDAGYALLDHITKMTAAGLLEKARTAIKNRDLTGAQSSLARAKALHADAITVEEISVLLATQQLEKP